VSSKNLVLLKRSPACFNRITMKGAARNSAAALLAVSVPAFGQYLGLKPAVEPPASPIIKPEVRRRISLDPLTLFRNLLSTSTDDRRSAYRTLRWDQDDAASPPTDVRLYATNLDAGPDLEYVLIVRGQLATAAAYLFDRDKESWWEVGRFYCSWHCFADQAERLIELREIVWYGREDIIVREQAGGTGVAETTLSIYRMYEGRLYRIFRMIEDRYDAPPGGSGTVTQRRQIEFPESDRASGKFLVVHYRKLTESDTSGRNGTLRETHSCIVYRWDAARFMFAEDNSAVSKFCAQSAK